jgi:hypothetical protein
MNPRFIMYIRFIGYEAFMPHKEGFSSSSISLWERAGRGEGHVRMNDLSVKERVPMEGKRNVLIFTIAVLVLSFCGHTAITGIAGAQLYPAPPLPSYPYLTPWQLTQPLLPSPLFIPLAPPVPFYPALPVAAFSRVAAVVTTAVPSTTALPPSLTPAGFTLTSLIPATTTTPVLPSTTTTYGALTSLVLSGTSPLTVLSFLL